MTLDNVEKTIRDVIPELLCIGDYRGRVIKCIEVLKNTHTEYDRYYKVQESDDVIEMLDTFLVEDEAYGFMKEHNGGAFYEVSKILDLCKCCLYEDKYHRDIPMQLVSYIREDHKVSILGIEIGDLLSDALKSLMRHEVWFTENKEYKCINIENDVVWKNEPIKFKLHIYHDSNRINKFYLTTSYNNRRWKAISVVDEIFAGCRYELKELTKEHIAQLYSSYYNVVEVYYSSGETNIKITSTKQYEKENKPWWKF